MGAEEIHSDTGLADPVAEADLADRERKRAASLRGRARPWKRAASLLAVGLVVLAALAAIPVHSVTHSGVDWHVVAVTANSSTGVGSYEFDDGAFEPSTTRCLQSGYSGTTNVCTDPWVAFTWYSQDGQSMSFQFAGSCMPKVGVNSCPLYTAQNVSSGGYFFRCGAEPRYCGEPFYIYTQNSSKLGWTFQWEILYNYTTDEPLL